MATESTISQLFADLLSGANDAGFVAPMLDDSLDAAEDLAVVEDHLIPPMDTLRAILTPVTPSDNGASLETLPAPSSENLTQAVQIETNRLLEEVLDRLAHNQDIADQHTTMPNGIAETSAAFVEAQAGENATGGMAIFNAAFIPGWPFQLFDKQSTLKLDQLRAVLTSEGGRNEAKVVSYLSGLGLNKDLLQKILKAFKTAAERTNFLVWISACFVIVVRTLRTLREEIIDPILNEDDDLGTGFRQTLRAISPKDRRFLRI